MHAITSSPSNMTRPRMVACDSELGRVSAGWLWPSEVDGMEQGRFQLDGVEDGHMVRDIECGSSRHRPLWVFGLNCWRIPPVPGGACAVRAGFRIAPIGPSSTPIRGTICGPISAIGDGGLQGPCGLPAALALTSPREAGHRAVF